MERVLYNTILGAWPIQADGTSFYYSDYANTGKKVWYGQKWPCCSGTFPQLAADYHISTYLRSADGVYVNLFTPSTLQLERRRRTLRTEAGNQVSVRQQNPDPGVRFAGQGLYALCPHSRLGGTGPGALGEWKASFRSGAAGNFCRDPAHLERWRSRRTRTAHAASSGARWTRIIRNLVALVQGPLVLFAVADSQPSFDRNALLQAKPANNATGDWLVNCSRRKQRDHASVHEHRQGKLQHVRVC